TMAAGTCLRFRSFAWNGFRRCLERTGTAAFGIRDGAGYLQSWRGSRPTRCDLRSVPARGLVLRKPRAVPAARRRARLRDDRLHSHLLDARAAAVVTSPLPLGEGLATAGFISARLQSGPGANSERCRQNAREGC